MPVEVEWIIQRGAADATSASLGRLRKRSPPCIPPHAGGNAFSLPACGEGWGGAEPSVPTEAAWIIKRCSADLTSGSLREVESEGHVYRAR
jgi:hypothetical protein